MMHDLYRRHFNSIDLFNRDCFGTYTVQFAGKTKFYTRRVFLAMLGMCETNALCAYRTVVGPITRYEWLVRLSDALINNPWLGGEYSESSEEDSGPAGAYQGRCGNQTYTTGTAKCGGCGALTHWKCACGYRACRAGTSESKPSKPCYFEHLLVTLRRS